MISVVMPRYNETKNLLGSGSGLGGSGYEVVVVDNGSPDGTAEVATRLRPEDATNYVDNR